MNMRENKLIRTLLMISAVALLILTMGIAYLRTDHEEAFLEGLTFTADMDGEKVSLKPFLEETDGRYYLILPSCFQGKETDLTVHYDKEDGRLFLNGEKIRNGSTVSGIQGEEVFSYQVKGNFGEFYCDREMQMLISEKLPSLFLTVEDTSFLEKDLEADKKKYAQTGDLLLLDQAGEAILTDHLEKLKVRGNLTATLDKKPYTFTLSKEASVCGMAPARKWNLIASATDGSYMRNKIVLDLANRAAGEEDYEPDGEFIDLFINGEYQGLYLITEAVEIRENRWNIAEDGGFAFEVELDFRKEEGKDYITTTGGRLFEVEEASGRRLSDERKQEAEELLNDVESALFAEDGISSISGKPLEELIDIRSWAIAWLVEEISGDHDVGIASQFAYTKGEDSLLYAGPVWDFDGTMGNVNTPMYEIPQALTASITMSRPEGNANQNTWLASMYQNPDFRQAVEEIYASSFQEPLEELLADGIDAYREEISRSAQLDALRWNEERFSWAFVIPDGVDVPSEGDYTRFDTLLPEIDMVKEYLTEKKDFLDGIWIEKKEYCIVEVKREAPFLNMDYNQTLYYWVEKGQPLPAILDEDREDSVFLGCFDDADGQQYVAGTPIMSDLVLTARWEQKEE